MMVTNSVLAAATASMLLLTSPFVAVHAQDPQGTCEQDSDHCGEWSVARAIQNGNTALGGYCSVGGGADNSAGKMETQLRDYAVVGGGDTNTAAAQKSVIAGGANNRIILFDSLPFEANQYCVISGGQRNNRSDDWEYRTTGSVITGGKKNSFNAPITAGNPKDHMTISGGRNNIVRGRQSVVTGGKDIDSYGLQSVVLGGQSNQALGDYSAVPGGFKNTAGGKASIAMGMKAKVEHDHSMVINLQGNAQPVVSTAEGQFLVQAKKYTFQVTNNPGPDNENVLFLNANNIQRLQDAIDSLPARRRELSSEMMDKRVLRREAQERRGRKLQLAREKYGLN